MQTQTKQSTAYSACYTNLKLFILGAGELPDQEINHQYVDKFLKSHKISCDKDSDLYEVVA